MSVGRIEQFDQGAGTGDHSPNHGSQETVAVFWWLLVMAGIIGIDFAHEDFAGLRGQSTAWRSRAGRSIVCSIVACHIILGRSLPLNRKQGVGAIFKLKNCAFQVGSGHAMANLPGRRKMQSRP